MRSRVIVSIGLIAILAFMICPMLAEESDGAIATYQFMDGSEMISWCLSDDIVVPEPKKEGMEFIGWTVYGEWVDPYTYIPEPGDTYITFYAHFREIPVPESDDTFTALCIIGAVLLMIAILVYWFSRFRHC